MTNQSDLPNKCLQVLPSDQDTTTGGCGIAPLRIMSLLVWNCRGLRNLVIEKELSDLTRAKDPFVMFIAKTWANEARLKKIKQNL